MAKKANTDDGSDNDSIESLTEREYVPVSDVGSALAPRQDSDYKVISRDADRFGNVLNAVLYDGENYAFASRRDDSYVQTDDGKKRPDWSIKQAGSSITITDASDIPEAYSDDELIHDEPVKSAYHFVTDALDELFQYGKTGWDIEDIGIGTITLYDPHATHRVTIEFEVGDDE